MGLRLPTDFSIENGQNTDFKNKKKVNRIRYSSILTIYLQALYIREIRSGLNTQEELRDHKLIIKSLTMSFCISSNGP